MNTTKKIINRIVVCGAMIAIGINIYDLWAKVRFKEFYGIPEKYFSFSQLVSGYRHNPFVAAGIMVSLAVICFLLTVITKSRRFREIMGVMSVLALTACIAICLFLGNVSNKKVYGITEQGKAVIAEYNGVLVMKDCQIDGENLILQKDVYFLEKKTDATVVYHKYKKISFAELE